MNVNFLTVKGDSCAEQIRLFSKRKGRYVKNTALQKLPNVEVKKEDKMLAHGFLKVENGTQEEVARAIRDLAKQQGVTVLKIDEVTHQTFGFYFSQTGEDPHDSIADYIRSAVGDMNIFFTVEAPDENGLEGFLRQVRTLPNVLSKDAYVVISQNLGAEQEAVEAFDGSY